MATSQPASRRSSSSIDPYHLHHQHQHNRLHTVSQETTTTTTATNTTTTTTVRRESRIHNWISEQCHLMVHDIGMEMGGSGREDGNEPDADLFSASTYVPMAQRVKAAAPLAGSTAAPTATALAIDTTTTATVTAANHKKTDSAVSAASSSSSSGHVAAAAVASPNGTNNLSGGWYWRTSSSSGGSSERDSLLASYVLPSHPEDSDVVIVGKEVADDEDDVDARSDSPLLGFGSDSDEEGAIQQQQQQQPQTHEQFLKIHRRSNSSEFMMDFPRTPGPEDMDSAFLTLSPPTPKQVLPMRSPPRDRLRYPKKGYRRELPSGLEDNVRHNYPSMSPQRIHSPSSKMQYSGATPPPRYGYSTSREDEVTTPVPHHHRGSPMSAGRQQRNSISPTTSPSLIPSSPSLFPSSSLSSYPSVTSLSSLHSQGQPTQQQQQVPLQPSLHSRPSLQSLQQQQQQVSPQHSPQLSSRPHSLSLSRKPSLARKPSFPLLKEVKEEEVDVDGAAMGALPDTPPHDILKHERMEMEEDEDEDHHQHQRNSETSTTTTMLDNAVSSPSSPQAVPSTPAMTTTALELLTLSPTGTEDTVTSASGTSSSGSTTSTIVPTAITTNATVVTAGRVPVSSRMRSQSASVVGQMQVLTSGSNAAVQNQGYGTASAYGGYPAPHAHAHAHSFSYSGSGSGIGFGGSSSFVPPASTSASPLSPAGLLPSASNSAVGSGSTAEQDLSLEEWSFPPVPPPRLSRASMGLGLGPGVGVRTQTRSRSGSDANLLSVYSTTPGFKTPPGTSILSAVGTPSSGGGRVVSEVEGGAGTRHAVYIVDSEEVSRRLGELLVDRDSVLLSSATGAGNGAEDEDEDDDLEDWESRRRTVVAVNQDEQEEEESQESAAILEEAQEQQPQNRVQADPVLPLGDLFSPRRPAPLVHSASMPVVPQYNNNPSSPTGTDSRPVTPPPSLGHRSSYSVGTMVNVTPTRKAPYPPATGTPRRQWTLTGAESDGSPILGVTTPPPNTPATATSSEHHRGNGGSFGIYASPYASSSQIYLGPGSPSVGHSREASRSKEHSRSPSKSSSSHSNSNGSSLKSHSRSSSKAHSRSSSVKSHHRYSGGPGGLASPPLPALPCSPPLPPLPPSSPSPNMSPAPSPSVHVIQPLMDAAPILTKADLARRLGPPPKRPPPAPPLDLGLDVGMLAGLNGAFRFPSPVPSPSAASVNFNLGNTADENSARRLSHRRSMLSQREEWEREREAEEERREYAGEFGYRRELPHQHHEREESGEMMELDEEMEEVKRAMGIYRDLDDGHRHHHHQQQQRFTEDEELGIRTNSHQSSRRTSGYLGEQEDTLRPHPRPSLHVNVRGSKRWSVDSVVLKDLVPPPHAHTVGAGPLSPPLPPIPQSAPIVQRRHQRHQAVAEEERPKPERSMSYFDDDDSENEEDLEDPDFMPMMGMAMMGVSVGGMMGVGGMRSARRKKAAATATTTTTTTSSHSGNGSESVKSRMGWGRRSRDDSKKDEKDKASKSAPSSPVATRKSREEKRKSFGRGDGVVGGEEGNSGKSRGRLASFFSKLAGSSAASSSASPSTANSSPSTHSPSGAHERKSLSANASEPDLRSTNGAWEALPSERVPPVPPMPPLHTLPRMESKASLRSIGSRSRRATMVSQQWDEEDNYGSVISPGTGVGNSVPPTPSSLASGFSLAAGTSPRESLVGSVGPNGLAPALRTSRSVSNLNLLVNRGGIQELNAGASGWMVSPPATPGMEHGFSVPSEHVSATLGSPQSGGDALRKSDDSGASLPPPPVPPKDFSQGGAHEWPPSPSLPSIPGSAASSTGLFPPGISAPGPNGNGSGVVMNQDKARDRMMVRLRLKSSPSLGSLRTAQQQSQGGKKLRNFAARMMGKEEYA